MSLDSRFFAPFWVSGHMVAAAYPHTIDINAEEDARRVNVTRAFYLSYIDVLPCPDVCAKHYAEKLSLYPIEPALLAGREALQEWFYTVHDSVNRDLRNQQRLKFDELLASDELRQVPQDRREEFLERMRLKIRYTRPSPPIDSVLHTYGSMSNDGGGIFEASGTEQELKEMRALAFEANDVDVQVFTCNLDAAGTRGIPVVKYGGYIVAFVARPNASDRRLVVMKGHERRYHVEMLSLSRELW